MLHGAGVPAGGRGDAVHPEHPQQRHHVHHAGASKSTAARRWSTRTTSTRSAPRATPRLPLMYWGKYVAARQQPRRHGAVPRADARTVDADVLRVDADRACTTCTRRRRTSTRRPARARTTSARPDHRQRVVAAGAERRDGDDEARRAWRVDLRLLRRLGAELHVLHRALAQRDRPLLRGAELRSGSTYERDARRDDDEQGVVPPEPAAADSIKWGPRNNTNIQQSAVLYLAEPRREEPRARTSRTTGSRTSARSTKGDERADRRLGDPGRPARARRTRPRR